MTVVRYSADATRNLTGIWEYTFANWGKAQADKYYKALIGSCKRLAGNPSLGRRYAEVPARYLGYREGRHIIFYNIVSPDEILIVRILHVSMDFKNRI